MANDSIYAGFLSGLGGGGGGGRLHKLSWLVIVKVISDSFNPQEMAAGGSHILPETLCCSEGQKVRIRTLVNGGVLLPHADWEGVNFIVG